MESSGDFIMYEVESVIEVFSKMPDIVENIEKPNELKFSGKDYFIGNIRDEFFKCAIRNLPGLYSHFTRLVKNSSSEEVLEDCKFYLQQVNNLLKEEIEGSIVENILDEK